MRKLINLLGGLLVLASLGAPVFAQQGLSRVAGVYDSTQYNQWGASIAAGNSATGSQSITVCPAYITLPDGRMFDPFSTSTPITIDPQNNAVTETVTPSAVSVVQPSGISGFAACEAVTATFSYTHGASLNQTQVISGDQGINEAIQDAENNSYGAVPNMVYWVIDPGIVTLNTGSQTTTLGSVDVPTRSVVMAATARVTTTITGCSGGWGLGFTSSDELAATNTTLTAGTTTDSSTIKTPYAFASSAAEPIVYCTTGEATAGAIHVRVSGYKVVAPAN